MVAPISVLEEEISVLCADLILVKGKLETQEAEKQLLEEKYTRSIQSLNDEALR